MNTKATALLAIGALGLAACGSSSYSGSSSTGATSTGSSSSGSQSAAASGGGYGSGGSKSSTTKAVSNKSAAKTVNITMQDYSFGPKTITGKPGSTIKVNLKNVSANQHNFKIDGQKAADADVAPGKSGTALVKIPASGSVQFYCEYHKGLGMVGTVKAS